jgi:hypothetical protein
MSDTLYKCTICGRIGSVGRCCGAETRIPLNDLAKKEHSKPTDKAGEIAKEVLNYFYPGQNVPQINIDRTADLIRPYLAPEYKYAQVPCSEHINTEGFTEAKLKPKKPIAAIGISVGEEKK